MLKSLPAAAQKSNPSTSAELCKLCAWLQDESTCRFKHVHASPKRCSCPTWHKAQNDERICLLQPVPDGLRHVHLVGVHLEEHCLLVWCHDLACPSPRRCANSRASAAARMRPTQGHCQQTLVDVADHVSSHATDRSAYASSCCGLMYRAMAASMQPEGC